MQPRFAHPRRRRWIGVLSHTASSVSTYSPAEPHVDRGQWTRGDHGGANVREPRTALDSRISRTLDERAHLLRGMPDHRRRRRLRAMAVRDVEERGTAPDSSAIDATSSTALIEQSEKSTPRGTDVNGRGAAVGRGGTVGADRWLSAALSGRRSQQQILKIRWCRRCPITMRSAGSESAMARTAAQATTSRTTTSTGVPASMTAPHAWSSSCAAPRFRCRATAPSVRPRHVRVRRRGRVCLTCRHGWSSRLVPTGERRGLLQGVIGDFGKVGGAEDVDGWS